jgi:hypothetical protein
VDERLPDESELTQDEMRANVLRLAFRNNEDDYGRFCALIHESVPEANAGILRGSAITGYKWKTGEPFDHKGPGTSDLDLTLVGSDVLRYYKATGYWIPGIHSRPMGEDDPDIAPELVPLREKLMAIVNRPVNIQGTRDWFQYFRGDMLGQAYLKLFGDLAL